LLFSLWCNGKEKYSMISEAEEEGRRKTTNEVF
jgi:hypothetical protein